MRFGRTVGVFSRTARYRRGAGFGLGACVVVVLAALTLPVPKPERGEVQGRESVLVETDLPTPVPEDLSLFLESRRWGGETLLDVQHRVAQAEAAATERRVIAKVGLVGVVNVNDRRASLIQLPDGAVHRFVPGDTLQDGRGVKAVTDRGVTLERNEGGRPEVLDLFPRIQPESALAGSDAETHGLPGVRPSS